MTKKYTLFTVLMVAGAGVYATEEPASTEGTFEVVGEKIEDALKVIKNLSLSHPSIPLTPIEEACPSCSKSLLKDLKDAPEEVIVEIYGELHRYLRCKDDNRCSNLENFHRNFAKKAMKKAYRNGTNPLDEVDAFVNKNIQCLNQWREFVKTQDTESQVS